MKLDFSPMRSMTPLRLERTGDTLIINDESYDFSGLPEGATLPCDAVNCAFLVSDVERQEGQILLTLILPHGAQAPAETLFPSPLVLTEDGPVALPPYDLEDTRT